MVKVVRQRDESFESLLTRFNSAVKEDKILNKYKEKIEYEPNNVSNRKKKIRKLLKSRQTTNENKLPNKKRR